MEHLYEISVFAGKALIFTVAIIAILATIAGIIVKNKPPKEHLEVENLNHKFKSLGENILHVISSDKERKMAEKERKKEFKKEKRSVESKPRVYVLNFKGDIKASAVEHFRSEVSAILSVARPGKDQVVVTLESAGGMVHAYGLAAAQLMRIKDNKLDLTICVDKMAASGGYMMACTADRILAAPFAIIGSIGVIAQVPNFHRLLKKNDVDYEEITAGEFKRTISLLAEITDKGRQKFLEQIEDTHALFKDFVQKQRPQLDLTQVATGEYWYGERAKELGLVDDLLSSDAYLFGLKDKADIFKIHMRSRKKLADKFSEVAEQSVEKALDRSLKQVLEMRYL